MVKNLFCLRHFEKDAVEPQDDVADKTLGLSGAGVIQGMMAAHRLGALLKNMRASVTHVQVSPYQRAIETERVLHFVWEDATVAIDERLRELKQGALLCDSFSSVCKKFPAYLDAIKKRGMTRVSPPGGECHAFRRDGDVRHLLSEAAQREGDEVFVTHAGIIDCIYQLVSNIRDEEVVRRWAQGERPLPGSILACQRNFGRWHVKFENLQLVDPRE